MANKDFSKLVISKNSIVKELEKAYLVELGSGHTIVVAKSLKSKFQNEKDPDSITFSIPNTFDFTARKSEKNAEGRYVVIEEIVIPASQLQYKYNE